MSNDYKSSTRNNKSTGPTLVLNLDPEIRDEAIELSLLWGWTYEEALEGWTYLETTLRDELARDLGVN